MLFDTPVYLIFLILVVVLYWRFRHAGQNRLLLAASYLFYGWWDWRFLGLMIMSTMVDYSLVPEDRSERPIERKRRKLC